MSAFYCQLDYEHVPYLSPVGASNGNISNNGCGVCSAAMLAENLLGVTFPPEAAARFAKMVGARETWGTDLYIFSPAFAAHLGMSVRDTEDAEEALRFLQEKRGMVIANTQGDRKDDGYIGVFSNGGHYIVIAGAEASTVKVWDPMYKEGSGRFDIPGRKGKVRLDGTDAYADMSVLKQDCKDRPFFLFEKLDKPAPAPMIGVIGGDDAQKAVIAAGGVPVVISPYLPPEKVCDCVSRMNGLVITEDSPIAEAALSCIREKNRPALITGFGVQAVMKLMGGEAASAKPASGVTAQRGTRLEVVAGGSYPVGDFTGCACESVPEGVRIAASDENGAVAAAECIYGGLTLGVNWRPEALFETDPNALALFSAIVECARADLPVRVYNYE